jgi:hypothetical protein
MNKGDERNVGMLIKEKNEWEYEKVINNGIYSTSRVMKSKLQHHTPFNNCPNSIIYIVVLFTHSSYAWPKHQNLV